MTYVHRYLGFDLLRNFDYFLFVFNCLLHEDVQREYLYFDFVPRKMLGPIINLPGRLFSIFILGGRLFATRTQVPSVGWVITPKLSPPVSF
jgi:hypothetical protein